MTMLENGLPEIPQVEIQVSRELPAALEVPNTEPMQSDSLTLWILGAVILLIFLR